ncbi:MAG TPA: 2OG-Fe(II) oxygenase [Oxalicibacterium sp.]|uniref:2OG-Fe(II) oxygenase n=1 Tax=Oxalicibacterium sp. TaxID=2766525 RepID=UPI002CE5832F|nr:2OG-Fe(II) oxygenase [Oxalicibacterium sp.]HWU98478.1 2OG-Fe(II) oxygenase [Oxalicibacterium sp.]
MGAIVHFPPDLKDWLTHNIRRGATAAPLIDAMKQQGFNPGIATALVNAFVSAAQGGKPFPADSIEIEDPVSNANEYGGFNAKKLASGNLLQAGDRTVKVAMRVASPALIVLDDFLSMQECDQLVEMAKPRLMPSTITDPVSGKTVVSENRSSNGMFFRPGENALIERIEHRIADLIVMPVENGEGLQILNYKPGAESTPHFDFLMPGNAENNASIARSGQRVSTMVMYLNDVDDGGGTFFPEAGLTVVPKKGSALYFEYCNEMNQLDGKSLHAGGRVLQGEKWAATKWMRQKVYVPAA